MTLYAVQSATESWRWHRQANLPRSWFGIVGSRGEWEQLVQTHPFLKNRQLHAVDWTSEVVVVAALGEAPTGGYAVRIKQVTREGTRVQVLVHMRSPGPSDVVTQVVTYPIDIACVQRHALPDADAQWMFIDQTGRRLGPVNGNLLG